ncbi:MAG: hypothetical protein IJH32_08980 [Ruminococcus sp.]|nr:hypothetical protein [Ruminococcus sp.]
MGAITDSTNSMSIEFNVGKDFIPISVNSGYTYDEDDGAIKYENIYRFSGRLATFDVRYRKATWEDFADTSWYNTSDTSFTIETAEELAGLAAIVNGTADGIDQDSFAGKNITLGDDISLYTDEDRLDGNGKEKRPWVPIGSFEAPFSGNFDGAGYTISGLNIPEYISQDADKDNTSGLFGMVKGAGSSVSISNVTLEDVNLSAHLGLYTEADSGQSMGALAGYCENCSISDVHVDQLTVNRKAKYIGGIIGRGDAMGSISDCTVEGAVFDLEDCNNIGGIVGIHYGNGADVNISNCYVSAQFGGSYASAGGIVGFGNGGAVGVENCYFTGSFDPEEDDSFNGGILGIGFSGVDNDYIINNCYANCDADLIGHGYFGYTAYTGEETIDYCLANYGNNLVVVNSSWSGDNDSFTWESYATDAGYDGYSHTVYKSDDYCYPDSAPSIYWTITTESEDEDKGTASNDATDDKIVKENDHTVTLNATPESGYEFDEWVIEGDYSLVGDSKLTDASCVIKPSGNITATAKFKEISAADSYTVTVASNDDTMGTVSGGGTVNDGDSVTVTAAAESGYDFLRWEIDGEEKSTEAVYTFTPDGDVTITAIFVAN